ncbi:UbiA prenyltransferase family protein [Tenacibaculum amylolyticum]|uniref:hypothetical protein n=1 Tax=Tenacibaculum amylolyticum TaxID=104269 RepID=UPI0038B4DAD6
MKVFKTILAFYINSSLHVAFAVYALVRITELYFGLPYNEPLDYFIFYGSITGYNFVKYAGIAKLHHMSLTKNLRLIQILSLISFVLMLYYASKIEYNTLLYFAPLGLLTLLYAVPMFNGLTKNLRNTASLKIIVIAIVWAGVTSLIPILNVDAYVNGKIVLVTIQRFLFVIVLTLPFDIRDLRFDKKHLQTIPQLIGIERTKKLGFVLLGITMVIEFFITPNHQFKVAYLIIFVLLLILLQRAKRKQSKYYASFWVESVPIIWWLLLLLLV